MSEIVQTTSPQTAPHDERLHRVSLVKGHDRWTFSWNKGEEAPLIRALAELAARKNAGFDTFDAAIVSHHVTLIATGGRPDGAAAHICEHAAIEPSAKGKPNTNSF